MPARGRARACGVLPLGLVISIDIENLDPPLIQLFTAMQKRCLIRADVDITTIYKMRLHYVWPCEEDALPSRFEWRSAPSRTPSLRPC